MVAEHAVAGKNDRGNRIDAGRGNGISCRVFVVVNCHSSESEDLADAIACGGGQPFVLRLPASKNRDNVFHEKDFHAATVVSVSANGDNLLVNRSSRSAKAPVHVHALGDVEIFQFRFYVAESALLLTAVDVPVRFH